MVAVKGGCTCQVYSSVTFTQGTRHQSEVEPSPRVVSGLACVESDLRDILEQRGEVAGSLVVWGWMVTAAVL